MHATLLLYGVYVAPCALCANRLYGRECCRRVFYACSNRCPLASLGPPFKQEYFSRV
ncbi:hypothetical protein CC80DRAFT_281567 [Byssothecium circinans]|uniref:Uncharacterized protein n=1 Tax=Byssothecium circinans TaxID=147558 RepID=A0A6A5TA36_9PLEO|nr:hypothetical protein CC80DRAFT_281567 [Byssothecium circinans]